MCCSGPNLAADACVDGVPTDCDYNCALILIPWFEDCSTLIGQLAGEQFGAYENAYNRCKQTDAPDLWMQIHNLQEQGCTVSLPAGDVATDAANNAAADACNLSGAPVHIDTCTASSEYSDDYTCDHVFDAEFEDLWYGDNDVRSVFLTLNDLHKGHKMVYTDRLRRLRDELRITSQEMIDRATGHGIGAFPTDITAADLDH